MVKSAKKDALSPNVTACIMTEVTAPLISVSQLTGIPSSISSPIMKQGVIPKAAGKADQHSRAALRQPISGISSPKASLKAAIETRRSSVIFEVSTLLFKSCRHASSRVFCVFLMSSIRFSTVFTPSGTISIPNFSAKAASPAVTLINAAGRCPI